MLRPLATLALAGTADAGWYNASWLYRKAIVLNGSCTLTWTQPGPGVSKVRIYRGTVTNTENVLVAELGQQTSWPPLCPATLCQVTSCRSASAISASQRSRFSTGFFWAFLQPFWRQRTCHLSRKQLTR